MDRKSQMSSSIYISEKSSSLSLKSSQKLKIRQPNIKVQIVNQNLDEAIRQVRNNIKENPEWNISSTINKSKKQPMPVINQSVFEKPGQNVLPVSKKQPEPSSLEGSRIDYERLKFTERMKKNYEERLRILKEKRSQRELASLEKQMKVKLQRKIKENMVLKEKKRIIEDIQERREEKMRLSDKQHLKKRQERSLLHQSNLEKVDMLRKIKRRAKKREINETQSLNEESKVELKFRQFLVDKQKQERKQLLVARFRMIKSASQGSVRTRAQARQAQTSQSTRKFIFHNDEVQY